MLDFSRVADLLSGLSLLQYFPADDGARLELAKMVARMASTEEQVEWFVARTLSLCTEWPGPVVLRQIFCSKFPPADGIEAGSTEAFPLGPPSEKGDMLCIAEREMMEAERRALPAGHVASADRGFDLAIQRLARDRDMNRLPRVIAEVPTNPDFVPITQADIDREVKALREKRARVEVDIQ